MAAIEIPVPIVPPPIIPIFLRSIGVPSFNSGIFVLALSAKKECIKPCLCGLSIHSSNNFLSFEIASAKSSLMPSSTDLIIACGENKLLYFFDAISLNFRIISSISFLSLILFCN